MQKDKFIYLIKFNFILLIYISLYDEFCEKYLWLFCRRK